jgi:hypothetical protein
MSNHWLDILKERLGKRRFEAQPNDWAQMEQLLNQHLPLPSTGTAAGGAGSSFLGSSIAQWAIAGLLIFGHATSDQQRSPLVDFTPIQETQSSTVEEELPDSNPSISPLTTESTASTNTTSEASILDNEHPNANSSSENEARVSASSDLKTIAEKPKSASTSAQKLPINQQPIAAENQDAPSTETAIIKASSKTDIANTESPRFIGETPSLPELSSAQASFTEDLQSLPLQLTDQLTDVSSTPLSAPSHPDNLLSKPFALRLGIDALRLESGVLPNNGWFYGLGVEWERNQQLFGMGLGMAMENVPLKGDEWVNQMQLNSSERWEVDTLYDRRIDTTWVIAGINQGYLRIDTSYTGRLDSISITEYDTVFTQMLQPYRQTISLQSYVLPLRYAWRFPIGRWDHRLGVQGQLGFTERVERIGDRAIQLDRQFRYAVGLDIGTDYYLLENWAFGLSWNPQYRAFGDAHLEDAMQWQAFRFHLRWRF